jgi:outer membrane protein TolC
VRLRRLRRGPRLQKTGGAGRAEWNIKDDPRIATQAAADSLWWKSFNDATLNHLVDLAYQQNLPLQIAGLRIVEARARLGVATGRQFPQVQVLSASGTAEGITKSTAEYSGLDRNFFAYQVGFDAVWELDFWASTGEAWSQRLPMCSPR